MQITTILLFKQASENSCLCKLESIFLLDYLENAVLRCNDESVMAWLDLRISRTRTRQESPDGAFLRWIHGTSNLAK